MKGHAMQTHVYAFGCNTEGQLGIKHNEGNVFRPVKVESLSGKGIINMAASQTHSTALGSNGILYTCGNNDRNELGREGRRFVFLPVLQLEAHKLISTGVGEGFTIALSSKGRAFSVGVNNFGQLGQGHREENDRWKAVKSGDDRIAMLNTGGKGHTMMVTKKGTVQAFGAGNVGQIGDGQFTSVTSPKVVGPLKNRPIIQVCCGSQHVLSLSSGGLVWAWGSNEYGQLGIMASTKSNRELRPQIVASLRVARPSFLACGGQHSMAMTKSGSVFSWGKGINGQLGHNDENNISLPKVIVQFQETCGIVGDLSCGQEHSMAIVYSKSTRADGVSVKKQTLYGWGLNAAGQLGLHGATGNNKLVRKVLRPKKIHFFDDMHDPFDEYAQERVARVFCGNLHTFVLTCDANSATQVPSALSNVHSPTISYARMSHFVDSVINAGNVRTSNEMRHLEAYIVDAFSSPACLNASFLKDTNGNEDQHGRDMRNVVSAVSATNGESGIDLLMVRKTYEILLHNNKLTDEIKKVIKTRLTYATYRLSETIRECFFNEKENLRVFLICFENPVLLETSTCHVALERIIRGWMSLSKNAREVLFSWLTSFPSEYLAQIVHVLQNFLSLIYSEKKMRGIDGTNALLLLAHIFQINEVKSILPYSMFYNAAISNMPRGELEQEYINWLQSSGSLAVHSLCQCPFVFEPYAKRLLLRAHAIKLMNTSIRTAIGAYFEAMSEGVCTSTTRKTPPFSLRFLF